MSLIPYTKRQLVQRIRKHVAGGYPDDAFATSTNEIMLYIDQSFAYQIKGAAYENAKVDGVLMIPEAFLVTFALPALTQDAPTGYWSATLPAPPLSLPLGYSITHAYFASVGRGRSDDIMPIENKRLGYRKFMPVPRGTFYWVENGIIWVWATNGQSLQGQQVYVQMPYARTDNLDAPMNMSDDVIEAIFNDVVTLLTKRYQEPKDIVHDDLPAGNNSLKS
jgi:hypothetical protein